MRARFRRLGGTVLTLAGLLAASAVPPAFAQDTRQLDTGHGRHAVSGTGNVFKVGVLQRDHLARWVLSDGTPLRTDDRTIWVDEALDNAQAAPVEGRSVRIMGQSGPGGLLVKFGSMRDQGEVAESLQMAPVAEPDTPAPVRPQ